MNLPELEKKAEAALKYLHGEAGNHAILRAQADHLESWCKVELARLKGLFVGMSAVAATDEALRHPAYLIALEALKIARERWYEAQFKREAASSIIEAWRTGCSNARANV